MSDMNDFEIGSGFGFSGQIIDELEASEYTLVTIALDETGSISGYERDIEEMLDTVLKACASDPYSMNLLVRIVKFGSQYSHGGGNGVSEVCGFTPLNGVDPAAFPALRGGGMTPLYDAVYSSVGAMNVYAKDLVDLDFAVNGITVVVTDGGENASVATANMVKDELEQSVKGEIMESHVSILIGIGTGSGDASGILKDFQDETGIDYFKWYGDATKSSLAKLAGWISQSISSTSQALGTGGASQNISATI